jgi:hypothetical protein
MTVMQFCPLPGDVVFVPFPFEEDRKILKKRPCLVLAVEEAGAKFLGAKITSTELPQWWAYPLYNNDILNGRLKGKSWINLNRREWLLCKDCVFKIATLKPEIWQRIRETFAI